MWSQVHLIIFMYIWTYVKTKRGTGIYDTYACKHANVYISANKIIEIYWQIQCIHVSIYDILYILILVWPILVRRRERVRDLLYCHLFWRSAGKKKTAGYFMLNHACWKNLGRVYPTQSIKHHQLQNCMKAKGNGHVGFQTWRRMLGLLQLCWLVIVNPSEMTRRTNIFNIISNYDTHLHTWMQKKTLLPVHSTCTCLYNGFFL